MTQELFRINDTNMEKSQLRGKENKHTSSVIPSSTHSAEGFMALRERQRGVEPERRWGRKTPENQNIKSEGGSRECRK